eukprot:3157647-Rhodomonas_salina.1
MMMFAWFIRQQPYRSWALRHPVLSVTVTAVRRESRSRRSRLRLHDHDPQPDSVTVVGLEDCNTYPGSRAISDPGSPTLLSFASTSSPTLAGTEAALAQLVRMPPKPSQRTFMQRIWTATSLAAISTLSALIVGSAAGIFFGTSKTVVYLVMNGDWAGLLQDVLTIIFAVVCDRTGAAGPSAGWSAVACAVAEPAQDEDGNSGGYGRHRAEPPHAQPRLLSRQRRLVSHLLFLCHCQKLALNPCASPQASGCA